MNVRFAEPCGLKPLELEDIEKKIEYKSIQDNRTDHEVLLTCEQDIYIGVFFDGTNNNKYRDTPGFSHSNVARLYEVYPGTPATQTPPKLATNPYTRKPREVFKDEAFTTSKTGDVPVSTIRTIKRPGAWRLCAPEKLSICMN